jgi:hypothetical protein
MKHRFEQDAKAAARERGPAQSRMHPKHLVFVGTFFMHPAIYQKR